MYAVASHSPLRCTFHLPTCLVCVTNTYCAQHHHNLIHDVEHGNAGTSYLPDNIKSEHHEIISSNSAKANLLLCFVLTQPSIHGYKLITDNIMSIT